MSGFAVLFNWLGKFWNALEAAFKWVLDGFILLIQFVVFTILDGLFSVVESFLGALDFSALVFNYAGTWSSLPPQLIWLINAVGLPQCFALLGVAYALRLGLNLIPAVFTRV